MSTDPTPFRTLRARKRADHLADMRDEIASALTHGLGAVAALAGGAVLITLAAIYGDGWQLGASIVFGITLLLLYTASTLYHAIQHPVAKGRLKVFDHCAIYLLIAGTYTPFALVNLRGPWGWSIFGLIWGLAGLGILLQSRLIRLKPLVTALPYVAMGWVAIIAIKPLFETVAPGGLALLFGGGAAYTLGSLFYVWRRLRFHHAIWHVFVLLGSGLHFFAILFYVIPLAR